MKTSRRGFFATLMAPLLGRLMPKRQDGEVFFFLNTSRIKFKPLGLNGFQESLNDGVSWSGDAYPTYGSIARNGFSNTPNWKSAADCGIVREVETRMIRARYELTAEIFEDPEIET